MAPLLFSDTVCLTCPPGGVWRRSLQTKIRNFSSTGREAHLRTRKAPDTSEWLEPAICAETQFQAASKDQDWNLLEWLDLILSWEAPDTSKNQDWNLSG